MLTLYFMLMACGPEDKTEDTSEEAATNDTTTPSTDDGVLDTMEEYVESYCSVYSLRCGGVYETQEECETDITSMWEGRVCTVVEPSLLEECIDWLAELSCDQTGWIEACDNFYSCE